MVHDNCLVIILDGVIVGNMSIMSAIRQVVDLKGATIGHQISKGWGQGMGTGGADITFHLTLILHNLNKIVLLYNIYQ